LKEKILPQDLKKNQSRLRQKRIFVGIIAAGMIAVIAFHFWFKSHSETMIERIVFAQSKGKIKLSVEDFKFNWFSNKMELHNAVFYTTDSSAPTITQLTTKKIEIKARGFLPLLFNTRILIDSIHIYSPKVEITKIGKSLKKIVEKQDSADVSDNFSVAKELGKISNSINDAIEVLQINRFVLDDGIFSLIDKTKKNITPFVVDKISIKLDSLQMGKTTQQKSQHKIFFTNDIAIRTFNQNIAFPSGKHFLSFKNFTVSLRDRRVTFDSCTIRGIKGDSSKSAFKIFFDQLQMTNINFDTLYTAEVIQADSVFCANPRISFDFDGDQPTAKGRKKIQNIDELVQQLLGDVMLNDVIVKNADINISTIRRGKTSRFESAKNNFELQGLTVRQNHERPVHIRRLFMNLQNYETVLQNGRYAIAFDSIRFENDTLTLSEFHFREYENKNILKNLTMPKFELHGLSWESLLYENTFDASGARFYNPSIEVWSAVDKNRKSKSIFETLSDLGQILNLAELEMFNGKITLHLEKNAMLRFSNTDLSLYADELTASKKIKNIQHSVKYLNVDTTTFSKGSFTISLKNLSLAKDKNEASASALMLTDEGMKATTGNVTIQSIILDSLDQMISINGLSWKNGNLSIYNKPKRNTQATQNENSVVFHNVFGENTFFKWEQNDKKIAAFLDTIAVNEIYKPAHENVQINGVQLFGKTGMMQSPNLQLNIGNFAVMNDSSAMQNITFNKINDRDSIHIKIPFLTATSNIANILSDNFFIKNMVVIEPIITAHWNNKINTQEEKKQPKISFASVWLQRPKIEFSFTGNNNISSRISWDGMKNNDFVHFINFTSTYEIPVNIEQADLFLTNIEYVNKKEKRISTNDNKLHLRFENLLLQKNDATGFEWKTNANILSLNHLHFDNLSKKPATLELDKGDIKNISLHSEHVKSVADVLNNSPDFQITGMNGTLTSANNKFQWQNFSFEKNLFNVDSFSVTPLQSIEDYKIKKAFNEDYFMMKSGSVRGFSFDVAKYFESGIFSIGMMQMNNIYLLSLKDKTQENISQKEKPLFTAFIKNIPVKLNIDSFLLNNMNVDYIEIDPKADTAILIPVSNMKLSAKNIKNFNLNKDDTLRITASGDVLSRLRTMLEIQSPYEDSSSAFFVKLRTGTMYLTAFNKVLLPLEGIEIVSGHLDSLNLEAFGNNDFSTGTMRMFYRGLKIKLMGKKDFQTQRFGNKIVSWLANIFFIRTDNKRKNAPVFFERMKDKSAINFLIKTTLSGIKSSVGSPDVRATQKKYFKNQRKK
jgi:hypothetical protein